MQRGVRCFLARQKLKILKFRKHADVIHEKYLNERKQNAKDHWEAELKQRREEWMAQKKRELARARHATMLAELNATMRYGWMEQYDHNDNQSFYQHQMTLVTRWAKPVYTQVEYKALLRIQALFRGAKIRRDNLREETRHRKLLLRYTAYLAYRRQCESTEEAQNLVRLAAIRTKKARQQACVIMNRSVVPSTTSVSLRLQESKMKRKMKAAAKTMIQLVAPDGYNPKKPQRRRSSLIVKRAVVPSNDAEAVMNDFIKQRLTHAAGTLEPERRTIVKDFNLTRIPYPFWCLGIGIPFTETWLPMAGQINLRGNSLEMELTNTDWTSEDIKGGETLMLVRWPFNRMMIDPNTFSTEICNFWACLTPQELSRTLKSQITVQLRDTNPLIDGKAVLAEQYVGADVFGYACFRVIGRQYPPNVDVDLLPRLSNTPVCYDCKKVDAVVVCKECRKGFCWHCYTEYHFPMGPYEDHIKNPRTRMWLNRTFLPYDKATKLIENLPDDDEEEYNDSDEEEIEHSDNEHEISDNNNSESLPNPAEDNDESKDNNNNNENNENNNNNNNNIEEIAQRNDEIEASASKNIASPSNDQITMTQLLERSKTKENEKEDSDKIPGRKPNTNVAHAKLTELGLEKPDDVDAMWLFLIQTLLWKWTISRSQKDSTNKKRNGDDNDEEESNNGKKFNGPLPFVEPSKTGIRKQRIVTKGGFGTNNVEFEEEIQEFFPNDLTEETYQPFFEHLSIKFDVPSVLKARGGSLQRLISCGRLTLLSSIQIVESPETALDWVWDKLEGLSSNKANQLPDMKKVFKKSLGACSGLRLWAQALGERFMFRTLEKCLREEIADRNSLNGKSEDDDLDGDDWSDDEDTKNKKKKPMNTKITSYEIEHQCRVCLRKYNPNENHSSACRRIGWHKAVSQTSILGIAHDTLQASLKSEIKSVIKYNPIKSKPSASLRRQSMPMINLPIKSSRPALPPPSFKEEQQNQALQIQQQLAEPPFIRNPALPKQSSSNDLLSNLSNSSSITPQIPVVNRRQSVDLSRIWQQKQLFKKRQMRKTRRSSIFDDPRLAMNQSTTRFAATMLGEKSVEDVLPPPTLLYTERPRAPLKGIPGMYEVRLSHKAAGKTLALINKDMVTPSPLQPVKLTLPQHRTLRIQYALHKSHQTLQKIPSPTELATPRPPSRDGGPINSMDEDFNKTPEPEEAPPWKTVIPLGQEMLLEFKCMATRVLQYGWQGVNEVGGSSYYFDLKGNTVWDAPEYDFKSYWAALQIQRLWRGHCGRKRCIEVVREADVIGLLRKLCLRASRRATYGFALEGVSTSMILSRFGRPQFLPYFDLVFTRQRRSSLVKMKQTLLTVLSRRKFKHLVGRNSSASPAGLKKNLRWSSYRSPALGKNSLEILQGLYEDDELSSRALACLSVAELTKLGIPKESAIELHSFIGDKFDPYGLSSQNVSLKDGKLKQSRSLVMPLNSQSVLSTPSKLNTKSTSSVKSSPLSAQSRTPTNNRPVSPNRPKTPSMRRSSIIAPTVSNNSLDLIFTHHGAREIYLKQYPSQTQKADHFAEVVASANFPPSMQMVFNCFKDFPSKPRACIAKVAELSQKEVTFSTPQDQFNALQWILPRLYRASLIMSRLGFEKMGRWIEESVKNEESKLELLLEKEELHASVAEGDADPRLAIARCLLRLRQTISKIFTIDSAVTSLQTKWRSILARKAYAAILARFDTAATKIQGCYRQCISRRVLAYYKALRQAHWEECYDDQSGLAFYFNASTNESVWEAPNDLVKPLGWWPSQTPPLDGTCFECQKHPATKRCQVCCFQDFAYRRYLNYSRVGETELIPMEYCTQCWIIRHDTGPLFRDHYYENLSPVYPTRTDLCIECLENPSVAFCTVCRDYLCLSCLQKVHGKGVKANHRHQKHWANAPLCIACNDALGIYQCEGCGGDTFCANCFVDVHSKGHRKEHSWKFHKEPTNDDDVPDAFWSSDSDKEQRKMIGKQECPLCHRLMVREQCENCGQWLCSECRNQPHVAYAPDDLDRINHKTIPDGMLENAKKDRMDQEEKDKIALKKKLRPKKEKAKVVAPLCKPTIFLHNAVGVGAEARCAIGEVCIECGQHATRKCLQCNDAYCDIKGDGNPGCFEKFHYTAARRKHVCANHPRMEFAMSALMLQKIWRGIMARVRVKRLQHERRDKAARSIQKIYRYLILRRQRKQEKKKGFFKRIVLQTKRKIAIARR
eukprot:TRINITY_DN1309_c1_g2_i2.p1 TRINITY_DN1309_c1_g2~~TRINITY_DN1309_c1_g2_i2.p1  ORF type:complete len:2284 (-),score=636.99 TRINITY_DN1309_c1_g2_i2:194-6847(-)